MGFCPILSIRYLRAWISVFGGGVVAVMVLGMALRRVVVAKAAAVVTDGSLFRWYGEKLVVRTVWYLRVLRMYTFFTCLSSIPYMYRAVWARSCSLVFGVLSMGIIPSCPNMKTSSICGGCPCHNVYSMLRIA